MAPRRGRDRKASRARARSCRAPLPRRAAAAPLPLRRAAPRRAAPPRRAAHLDRVVHRLAGHHEDDDGARLCDGVDKLLHVLEAHDGQVALLLGARDGVVDLGRRAVAHGDLDLGVLRDVEREVLAHDGEAVEADRA
jgi:hypothetical protein